MIFKKKLSPVLIFSQRIWDAAPHNAFTDLIRFRGQLLCIFRESDKHVKSQNGVIRLIGSKDSVNWNSIHLFEEEGVDLRDPKLSITPDGRLMLLVGGSKVNKSNGKLISFQSRVSFSKDGIKWSALHPVLDENQWLWRVTWHHEKAYGIAYHFDPAHREKEWTIALYESDDGKKFRAVTDLHVQGKPNEATVRLMHTGEMLALVRRDRRGANEAVIGLSHPPYTEWQWAISNMHLGSPNFLALPDGALWAAGRYIFPTPYDQFEKTILTSMEEGLGDPILFLPSSGDTGYPGMVFDDDYLWISYYSSHEEKTAIYLAKVKV